MTEASQDPRTGLSGISKTSPLDSETAEQLRRYDSILANTPTLLAYIDQELRFRFASRAYCDLHQIPSHELAGKTVDSVVGPDTFECIQGHVRAALAGERQQFEMLLHTNNGEPRWVSATYIPDRSEGGRVHGFFAFIQDVHERKVVEESRARLLYAVDQGMEGFSLHDQDGLFTYVNPAEANMYGYSPEEVIGKSWRLFYDDDEVRKIEAVHFPTLRRDGRWRGELKGLKKNGERFDVEVSLTLLTDEQGQPSGLICNCRDITERKIADASMRQLQKMEALGQLTGGIAHDFNNLLSVILGNLDLVRHQEPDDPAVAEFLGHALEAVERGATLTRRLLLFSRKKPLEPKALDLNDLVRGMDDLMRRSLGERITVRIHEGEQLALCESDASLLENVVLNLALNARDAMPSGGTLTIATHNAAAAETAELTGPGAAGEDFVCLTVTDTGIGMSPEVQEQVFDPFFTTKAPERGSGLGLSMVHGFVQQSGGHIALESREGEGTTFRLYLPRSRAERDDVDHGTTANVPVGQQETILVVEDDPHVRRLVVRLLEDLNYRVVEAEAAESALQALAETDFDLILTDVVLPGGISGPELVDQVWQTNAEARVLFMSGYNESADVATAPAGGAVRKLHKPFTRQELARTVRLVLEHPGH